LLVPALLLGDTPAVRKKRCLWVALGVIALVMVCFAFLRPHDEPKYQGRYLSEWLQAYKENNHTAWRLAEMQEAAHAVRAVGTNGLPYYLTWLRYEPPAWQRTLRLKLPRWIEQNKIVADWLGDEAARRADYGSLGIWILGTNATTAIPELTAMMKGATNSFSVSRAIFTLSQVGEPAIPVLLSALADQTQPYRQNIVWNLGRLALAGHTNPCLPILVEALNDSDAWVRSEATNAVENIAPHILTNGPAQ
jgi:hypothetical protein